MTVICATFCRLYKLKLVYFFQNSTVFYSFYALTNKKKTRLNNRRCVHYLNHLCTHLQSALALKLTILKYMLFSKTL